MHVRTPSSLTWMYCICVCRCMQKPELHPSTSANHQTRDSKIYITSHTYMYTPTATTILYIQFCIRFHGSQYIYMILKLLWCCMAGALKLNPDVLFNFRVLQTELRGRSGNKAVTELQKELLCKQGHMSYWCIPRIRYPVTLQHSYKSVIRALEPKKGWFVL